jgi:protein-S-isoprenylcysteine O-methyltransferase Ste14
MTIATDIRVIPPLIPLVTMSLGFGLHLIWPAPITDSALVRWVGLAILLLSFAPALSGLHALRTGGTTADVRKSATALVTHGIFRYTRNPMYLALMLLCVGLAMIVNSLFMLLLVVPTGSVLCLAVIRKEEAFLLARFGERYSDYLSSVRRWA